MTYDSLPGRNVSLKPGDVRAKGIDLGFIHTTVIKADETSKWDHKEEPDQNKADS